MFTDSTETPRSVLTKSIAAKTKADCYTAFPQPGQTGSNAAKLQKLNEQQSCLNQWNDYTPSLIRHFMNEQTDERYSFDARLDFQATDNLTFFAKGTYSGRNVHDQNRSRTPVSLLTANVAGTFRIRPPAIPACVRVRQRHRPAIISTTRPASSGSATADFLTNGATLNVVPGSVVVDDKHNVTR